MEQSLIATVIVLCTCLLYVFEIFPVALTTLIGLLAMIFANIITPAEAFSGFASTPVMLVIGMVIIINSLLDSGVAGKIGNMLAKCIGKSEKSFVIIVFVISACLSMFMTNAALVAMFMPFIASVAASSNGKITKKNTYLTLATGGLIGGTGTLVGSTAPLLASNALESANVRAFGFFETLPITLILIGVMVICYQTFLYKFQKNCFDFEEVKDVSEQNIEQIKLDKRKAIISVLVFLVCIILFIFQPFGWDLGLIAITGAVVIVATKCVDGRETLRNMFWSALITLGAALGIAKAFVNTGAGEIAIRWLVDNLGIWVANPMILVAVFLSSGYILSQFMSNGSLVAMLSSIAVPMGIEVGINPIPLAMACVYGASLAMSTPAATTSVTMVQIAGYRFKDYFKVGGLTGIIGLITSWISIVLIYKLY